ncbi:MAG: M15 family metallopeptidase [Clostridia bacterium]|nr:M15 family metallopeptidase [Clostridia bacterium]
MAAKTEQQRRQSRAASKRRRRKQNQRIVAVLAVILLALLVWLCVRAASCAGDASPKPDVSDAPTTVTTTPTTAAPNQEYTADGHYVQPEGGDWNLLLVNGWNPMTEAEANAVPLAAFNASWDFDERALPHLNEMLDAANAAGCHLWGQSLFRPYSLQKALYEDQVNALLSEGYDRQEAETQAATIVARPGCSEHNTGLAVDVECADFADLDEGFKDTFAYEWLQEHCAEFGFILRFPQDKEDITGVIYEPWHYRYVGVEAATEIMSRGLCLEEYLEEKGL